MQLQSQQTASRVPAVAEEPGGGRATARPKELELLLLLARYSFTLETPRTQPCTLYCRGPFYCS